MHEKSQLRHSRWRAWIEALPETVNAAVTFSDQAIAELDDPDLEASVKRARAEFQNDWEELRSNIFASSPHSFPRNRFNFETYTWARLIIDSRCWTLKGTRLCVPGADFFNYGVSDDQNNPNSNLLGHFFVDYHKVGTHKSVDTVDIYSDRDCNAGEQLLEAYGESNNIFLAQWFGFAPIPNPSDFVSFKWLFQPNRGSHSEEKLSMLNLFRGEIQANFKIRKIDTLPDSVLNYLKVTTLPSHFMEKCSRSRDKQMLLACLAPHKSAAMYDELLEILQDKLEGFRTTLDEDQALLRNDMPSEKHLMVTVRTHHKMIIQHNIAMVKAFQNDGALKSEL